MKHIKQKRDKKSASNLCNLVDDFTEVQFWNDSVEWMSVWKIMEIFQLEFRSLDQCHSQSLSISAVLTIKTWHISGAERL